MGEPYPLRTPLHSYSLPFSPGSFASSLTPVVEERPVEVFAQLGQSALEDLAHASLGQLESFADLL